MNKLILLFITLISLIGNFNTYCGLFSLETPAVSDNPEGKPEESECNRNCDCASGLTCINKTCKKPSKTLPNANCHKLPQ